MECVPEKDLLDRLEAAGIDRRELVKELDRPYGTICCWLNGYNPLPIKYRKAIEKIIKDRMAF